MVKIGDVEIGQNIGRRGANGRRKYVWHACVDCGKERWVTIYGGKPAHSRCRSCSTKLHKWTPEQRENMSKVKKGKNTGGDCHWWKGGRIITGGGYIRVKLYPDDFFSAMADKRGYVLEHRLVMAKSLGRCLHRWEIVHHKNHIKDDNRIENLQLVSDDRHNQITILETQIKKLKTENKELRKKLHL